MQVELDRSLTELNAFGFAQRAHRFVQSHSRDTLAEACEEARKQAWPVFILGGGSNLVLTRDIPGLVIQPAQSEVVFDDSLCQVTAQAGVPWHSLVRRTLDAGYGGLENLSLIPGSTGAAPIQNIGAYGVELCERVVSVDVLHLPDGQWLTLTADDCEFGYRTSLFKRNPGVYAVHALTLQLNRGEPVTTHYGSLKAELARAGLDSPTPRDVSAIVSSIRQSKLPDPSRIGNAGSFFQNPIIESNRFASLSTEYPGLVGYSQADGQVKLAAGWLIESLGFKGRRVGAVGVHSKQALVLVHTGGGTGEQLLELAGCIQAAVQDRFGVALTIEPIVI